MLDAVGASAALDVGFISKRFYSESYIFYLCWIIGAKTVHPYAEEAEKSTAFTPHGPRTLDSDWSRGVGGNLSFSDIFKEFVFFCNVTSFMGEKSEKLVRERCFIAALM